MGELSMEFLHGGLPRVTREATYTLPKFGARQIANENWTPEKALLEHLAHPNVASKEWVIRQYDHEVQAGSVIKPLVGTRAHGPSDGAVVAPILGSTVGFAMGLGMNPNLGDIDPYNMAQAAIDESLRNVVCLGGDPNHTAILDNFCWGNAQKPDRLGGLVRAAYGCLDAALALGTPFVSGKDSLNNEFKVGDTTIAIPPSLLVTALARVPDIRRATTMDMKASGNAILVVGSTGAEMGGSLHSILLDKRSSELPPFRGQRAHALFQAVHRAISKGFVRSCHDPSEGGLAVALAEMVLAGEIGASIELSHMPMDSSSVPDDALLFGESLTRFLLEVEQQHVRAFLAEFEGLPVAVVGQTTEEPLLVIQRSGRHLIALQAETLEAAWRPVLARHLDPAKETAHG
jgi:phosphoribosylformylglycinamidine synthase